MQRQRLIKYFWATLFLFIFLELFYLTGKKIKQRWIIEKTIHSEHWQKRAKQIENVPKGKYKTVFLGNSLTEMFDLQYYFNDSTILNCGITGDFSEGILKRLDAITDLKPKKLFVEIGINDIIEKISLDDICNNYEQLIIKIQKESPQTQIYIQSNLPLVINRFSLLTDNDDVNAHVIEQNKNLMKIAAKYHCTYIDIFSQMVKEKDRLSLFIMDGIHLTPKSYEIWTKVVSPYLNK
jgi:lysophospholipase L1-like esterase